MVLEKKEGHDVGRAQPDNILVVENQIRPPNVSGGNSDLFDATVILWVPLQVHIFPLLKKDTQNNGKYFNNDNQYWCFIL